MTGKTHRGDEQGHVARRSQAPGADRWMVPALLTGEIGLLAVIHGLHAPWGFWLAGHLILVGSFAVMEWQRRRPGGDLSAFGLTVLSALAGGPAGVLLVMAALWLRRENTQPTLLADWYDRIALSGDIDSVTRLSDTVAMGRALLTTGSAPRPFAEVMATGSLADRQTALGLIARRFSPSYAQALKAALVTGEPMVRVQAAAVAVKVRAELKAAVRSGITAAAGLGGGDGARAAVLSRQLREFASTGMLEDDDRAAAERAIGRLAALASGGDGPRGFDADMREHLETELLRSGNYSGFRTIRSGAADAAGLEAGAARD